MRTIWPAENGLLYSLHGPGDNDLRTSVVSSQLADGTSPSRRSAFAFIDEEKLKLRQLFYLSANQVLLFM
jgi:hypothetical protein